jgi:imidazole glycerol phosphate synthase glutamine amidotransferase subunit
MKIALIDYEGGNLPSVRNAFEALGCTVLTTRCPREIAQADLVVLPGQGHFGQVMESLAGFVPFLREIASTRPFLGICVGMQVLLESSAEAPGVSGLGVCKGMVSPFPTTIKTPHMGWNWVAERKAYYYFAHSYICEPQDTSLILGTTRYGNTFPAIIGKDRWLGVQFHPEKSGKEGIQFLKECLERLC